MDIIFFSSRDKATRLSTLFVSETLYLQFLFKETTVKRSAKLFRFSKIFTKNVVGVNTIHNDFADTMSSLIIVFKDYV